MGNRAAAVRQNIQSKYPDAVLSSRGRTSLTYALPDGRNVLSTAIGPLHYDDASGGTHEIDTTLIEVAPDTFETADTEYQIELLRNGRRRVYPRKNVNEYVQFQAPQYRDGPWNNFNWTIEGDVDDDRILWDGPDASLIVRMMPTGVKVDIVLKTALTTELRWPVSVSGLNYDAATHSLFSTSDGQTVLYLQEPFIIDANGTERHGLNVTYGGTHINISDIDDTGLVYPITIDPTVDSFSVSAATDDGHYSHPTGTAFSTTLSQMFMAGLSSSVPRGIFMRYASLPFDADTPIIDVTLTMRAAVAESGELTMTIRGVAEDNPSTISNVSDAQGRTRTTAQVTWNTPNWVNTIFYETPSVSDVFDEIVNRPGWVAGNAMVFLVDPGAGSVAKVVSTYQSSFGGPVLNVEYEGGAPPPQIAHPVSDVATGDWTPTPLYAQLDDDSTATSVTSSIDPDDDSFTVALGSVDDPGIDTDHRFSFSYRKGEAGGNQIDLTVELLQGTTVIATRSYPDISGTGWFNDTITLSEAEAAEITDYSDLRARFTADTVL